MMKYLANAVRALGSGMVGGAVNVILLVILWNITSSGPGYSHAFLYKQAAWGALWGLPFLIPLLANNWWLRGMVWGTLASVVALFVFKVVPVSVATVIMSLLVNAGAWGLTASWLYQISGSLPARGADADRSVP